MTNMWVGDIEANGLLDTVDTIHCACFKRLGCDEWVEFTPDSMHLIGPWIAGNVDVAAFHNGWGYDLPAIEKVLHIPFGFKKWNGRKVLFMDTLVMSQVANPDLEGGHGLEAWGNRLGYPKGSINKEFGVFTPAMLEYCKRDVEITEKLYLKLIKELGLEV